MAGNLIPPAVITITATSTDVTTTLAKVKTQLADFAKQVTQTRLGATSKQFQSDLTTAKTELLNFSKQVSNAKLAADAKPFWTDIAALRTTLAAMSPLDVNVDANTSRVLAQIEALKGTLALQSIKIPVTLDTSGAGTSALSAALSKFFTLKIGRFGGIGGGVGTALGLSGISVEHMAVAGVDFIGSAAAGLAGGLLKGLAGGATMAVGIGTDLAGIGQAAGDIRTINTDTNNLNQAVAIYGKNSAQAQAAQAQLNYDLKSFSAIARGPVQNAVKALQQFKGLFDKFTGPAEAKGANIITQGIKVAEQFLPIIGKFASINMTKISQGLQPLFKFLSSGGKGMQVFVELEKIFSSHLATGMSAFVNGFESLVKVIGMVAPKTGGFMASLNRFFTDLNKQLSNPKSADSMHVNNLLASWNAWYSFLKQLVVDIARLFSGGKDQKTGLTMVKQLTGYLQELGKWESSVSGTKSITRLFKASKGELTSLLSILPPLAKSFGTLIGALAPGMHLGMTVAIKGFVTLLDTFASALKAVSKIPGLGTVVGAIAGFAGAALGIGYIASKLRILTPVIDGLLKVLAGAGATKIPVIGSLIQKLIGGTSSNATFATSVTEFSAAVTRFVGGSVAGAGVGAEEGALAGGLSSKMSTLGKTLGIGFAVYVGAQAAGWALKFIPGVKAALAVAPGWTKTLFNIPLAGPIVKAGYEAGAALRKGVVNGAHALASVFSNVAVSGAQLKKLGPQLATILGEVQTGSLQKNVANAMEKALKLGTSGNPWAGQIIEAMAASKQISKSQESAMLALQKEVFADATKAGMSIPTGLAKGISSSSAAKAAADLGKKTVDAARLKLGAKSPSLEFIKLGQDIVSGLGLGITKDTPHAIAVVGSLGIQLHAKLHSDLPLMRSAGEDISAELAAGIRTNQGQITSALKASMQAALNEALKEALADVTKQVQAMALAAARSGAGTLY